MFSCICVFLLLFFLLWDFVCFSLVLSAGRSFLKVGREDRVLRAFVCGFLFPLTPCVCVCVDCDEI